jgi:hypothetical protein
MHNHIAPVVGDPSPWGAVDHVYPLGPDVVAVATPSHGGLWVSPEAMTLIPAPLHATAYSSGGWFEEDCDWCIPYIALGLHRFEASAGRGAEVLETARRTLLSCHGRLASLLTEGPDAPPV